MWAQWLHKTPAAQNLLDGYAGDRLKNVRGRVTLNQDDTYEVTPEFLPDVAPFLPKVTILVCTDCNRGWMSGLEEKAKSLLAPLIFDNRPVRLDRDDQRLLSAWAAKTFMAYAVTLGTQGNPFTPEDYEYLRLNRVPPAGMQIWVFSASSRWAEVGLQIEPFILHDESFRPDLHGMNSAVASLAAGGVVFLMMKLPPQMAQLAASLGPPAAGQWPQEITAGGTEIKLEPGELDEEYLDQVHRWQFSINQHTLPSPVGMTTDALDRLKEAHFAGVSTQALKEIRRGVLPEDAKTAAEQVQRAEMNAQSFIDAGDPVGAARLLTRATREHFYRGDFVGAARLAEGEVSIPSGGLEADPEAAYRIGQAYWNLGDPRGAGWYRRAIQLGMNHNHPRFGLVDSLMWGGNYAESLGELALISPADDHEVSVVFVAKAALSFLVEDLCISVQTRSAVPRDALTTLDHESLWKLLRGKDAISRPLWIKLGLAPRTVKFHLARAWFGCTADAWIMACLWLVHSGEDERLVPVLRLGLSKSLNLGLDGDEVLSVFEASGIDVTKVRHALDVARKARD